MGMNVQGTHEHSKQPAHKVAKPSDVNDAFYRVFSCGENGSILRCRHAVYNTASIRDSSHPAQGLTPALFCCIFAAFLHQSQRESISVNAVQHPSCCALL